jgi:hypothetical protein
MGVPGNANALLLASAAGGAYQITRSLRFNAPDSAYLSRTPSVAGNRKTWTWAGWVKRSGLGTDQGLIEGFVNSNAWTTFFVNSSNELQFQTFANGSLNLLWKTVAVFRDPSAWYHVVITNDTTQASSSNAVKIYVNGIQQTLTTTFSTGSYLQNRDLDINSTASQRMGVWGFTNTYLSGYLADVHFIDGQALDPSSFTETDATTGQLIPKAYTGSYGTNGAQLKFADNSSNTATTLGKDTSGNGNNWTPNNLSVTAGAGNDSLVDVPTNGAQTDTGVGGEVRGNYCTWNPLSGSLGTRTLSNGNLDTSNSGNGNTYSTFELSSGKWYVEATLAAISGSSGATFIGITASSGNRSGDNAQNLTPNVAYGADGTKIVDAASSSYGASFTANDVIGIAFDIDGGSVTFYKNGSTQGAISKTLSGAGKGTWSLFTVSASGSASNSWSLNAGQRPFAYTAPSGFKALNTANLPAPLVTKPSTVMDVLTWTGNSASSRALTGLGFSPDFVWIKDRSVNYNHVLFDAVRGAGGSKVLFSNRTTAEGGGAGEEGTNYGAITSFDSSGFTVAPGAVSSIWVNQSSDAYVGWCWDAGTTTVSNTQGSITSSVRANPSAGFSVVSFTGNQTSGATVGHGLNVAPQMILLKSRSATGAWHVYHESIGNTKYLVLNATDATATSAAAWNNTSPTSSVFTLGNNIQPSGVTQIAYCFAPVSGYSNFGSYTGNGSNDGPFVYTGFRPRWILFKNSSSSSADTDWTLWDSARSPYNAVSKYLLANKSNAEGDVAYVDLLSNGFKMRYHDAGPNNASGQTYIYAAFAESPFQYARAR